MCSARGGEQAEQARECECQMRENKEALQDLLGSALCTF